MKKKWGINALLFLLALIQSAFAGSDPNFNEGQWEITTQVEMAGMPMQMPPVTHFQCLSKNAPVPSNTQPGQQCQIKDMKTTGNTVTWNIECRTQDGQMNGSGKITYSGDNFQGSMQMAINPGNMRMNYSMKGRRVGPCK